MSEHDERDEQQPEGAVSPSDEPGPSDDEQAVDEPGEPQERPQAASEASQPQGDSPKAVRDLEKKITGERERHAKRLGDILGDASTDVLPCPLCFNGLHGFVLPGDAEHMPDEQRAAAIAFLGGDVPSELEPAEGVVMCDRCKGHGQLRFPTRNPHLGNQTCPKCTGNGYVLEGQPASNVRPIAGALTSTTYVPPSEAGPCPLCGSPNSAGKPHFCNPVAAAGP